MTPLSSPSPLVSILAFDASNQLAVRNVKSGSELAFVDIDLESASLRLNKAFPETTPPVEYTAFDLNGQSYVLYFCQVSGASTETTVQFRSIECLEKTPARPHGGACGEPKGAIGPYLIDVPVPAPGEKATSSISFAQKRSAIRRSMPRTGTRVPSTNQSYAPRSKRGHASTNAPRRPRSPSTSAPYAM